MDILLYSPTAVSHCITTVGGCTCRPKARPRPRPSLRKKRWRALRSLQELQRVRVVGFGWRVVQVEVLAGASSSASFGAPSEVLGYGPGAPAEDLGFFCCFFGHRPGSGSSCSSGRLSYLNVIFLGIIINIFCDFPKICRANPRPLQ